MKGRRAKVVVEAERFVLRDAGGNRRATLDVERDGPTLSFLSEGGGPRFILTVGSHGPICRILDKNGNLQSILSIGEKGAGFTLRSQPLDTSLTVAALPHGLYVAYHDRSSGAGGGIYLKPEPQGLGIYDHFEQRLGGVPSNEPSSQKA
jgi:hypothetical protein